MVFASESFLYLFLPCFLALYFLAPYRWRNAVILLGSYVFYGWWRLDFLSLLILTTLFTFMIGKAIARSASQQMAKRFLILGLIGCLSVLGIFKYLNFFLESVTALFAMRPEEIGIHWRILLPIGISFYIFQSISYLVDVYRKDTPPARNLLDFAAFLALFPQLIAGPILRYKDLASQLSRRRHSFDNVSDGFSRFLIGLGKKVLIADSFAPLVDLGFGDDAPSMLIAWIAVLAYALQLYFDFSGYSDMAIGLGKMMGFHFPENFRAPYRAASITEFWRRWHISLSTWLRDYLYVPLGGSRGSTAVTYRNLMVVMLLGGLWHGAQWTFLLWGAWHGSLLAIERATGWGVRMGARPFAHTLTLFLVLLGWVFFRAADVTEALRMFSAMFGGQGAWPGAEIWHSLPKESLAAACVALFIVWSEPGPGMPVRHVSDEFTRWWAQIKRPLASTAIGLIAVFRLAEQSYSPFLYFQF